MLKKLHLWTGIIFLILFLLTGQYFRIYLHGLQTLPDAERLLLKTGHVYLFFASFINIMFGLYWPEPEKIKWTTIANQSLILISPVLLTYSFIFEAALTYNISRLVGALGVILIFIWLVTTATGVVWKKLR